MLEKMVDESPEEVFFAYSHPCSSELLKLGLIEKEVREVIEDYLERSEVPDRIFLELTYPNAVRRITDLAKTLGKETWDSIVIRKYFLDEHNKVILRQEGNYKLMPESERELCKVKVGKVLKKYEISKGLVCYDVFYGDKVVRAIGKYYPNADVGDFISIHWNFAVEKVDDNLNK